MRHKTVILYTLSILAGLVLWELVAAQFSKVVLSPPTAVAKHLYAHMITLELPLGT